MIIKRNCIRLGRMDTDYGFITDVREIMGYSLTVDALKASNKYKEKKVELTGKVESIDSSGEYFTLGIMSDEFSLDSIMCMIEEEHLNDGMAFFYLSSVNQKVYIVQKVKLKLISAGK